MIGQPGIGNNDFVIVYDDASTTLATRLWWTLHCGLPVCQSLPPMMMLRGSNGAMTFANPESNRLRTQPRRDSIATRSAS